MKFPLLTLGFILSLSCQALAIEVRRGTAVQNVQPATRMPQPAYYENGRPVYIDIKPVKPKCRTDENYNRALKKCKKRIKTVY